MRTRTAFLVVAALLAAFTITTQPSAQADTFGSGTNTFFIDFVNISNAGNSADTTGYGTVPYNYRIGTYEISRDAIDKATASGMANVMTGSWSWTGRKPAAYISWYEAAAFVNWLNTSTGRQAAYDLTFNPGTGWSLTLWSSSDAWQAGGQNLYRHKNAHYFLPNENEWYKAAYFNASASNYYSYPTGSNTIPGAVISGTGAGTAVYFQNYSQGPAEVVNAGGLSPYGTMGQGGNVWEWTENAHDGANNSPSEARVARGGDWFDDGQFLRSSGRSGAMLPVADAGGVGFRVASVPQDSLAQTTNNPVVAIMTTKSTATLTWDASISGPANVEHSQDLSIWTTISASNLTGTFQHAFGTLIKGFYRLRWDRSLSPSANMVTVQGGVLPPSSQIAGTTVSSFRISKYEVTWKEWQEVRAWALKNGYTDLAGVGGGIGGDHPVHSVNWYDVAKWCNAKSEMEGLTPVYLLRGKVYRTGQSNDFTMGEWDNDDFQPKIVAGANGYRLPSVAEWEWAARGGMESLSYTYSGSNDLYAVAWWSGNSGGSTRMVGQKQANELGLHDMSGNVAEWGFDPMPYTITRNGVLWAELGRPRCGSRWSSQSGETVAVRYRINEPEVAGRSADIGFRLARNAP